MSVRRGPFPLPPPPETRGEEFARIADLLQREREAAAIEVEPLLAATADWADLHLHPALDHSGALERLGKLVARTLNSDPQYALRVARLAVAVAEALPDDAYRPVTMAQLRGDAWKDAGNALRVLGRYDEAFHALTAAEAEFEKFAGVLAHDRANARFILAIALQETDRHNESLALLADCKTVFRGHGDMDALVRCGLAEAVLLQRLHRSREAREACLLLLAGNANLSKENRAALHHTVGFCSVDLADFVEAEENLQQAINLYREIGQPLHALTGEAVRGRLFLRRGDPALAVTHLRHVRREFIRSSLAEEAGICGLEIVEGLLVLGRAAEAENLARKIVHEFTSAKLNTRAITALSYLTEAIVAKRASATMAHDVREYIVSLRTSPEREFTMTRA